MHSQILSCCLFIYFKSIVGGKKRNYFPNDPIYGFVFTYFFKYFLFVENSQLKGNLLLVSQGLETERKERERFKFEILSLEKKIYSLQHTELQSTAQNNTQFNSLAETLSKENGINLTYITESNNSFKCNFELTFT